MCEPLLSQEKYFLANYQVQDVWGVAYKLPFNVNNGSVNEQKGIPFIKLQEILFYASLSLKRRYAQ